MSANKCGIGWRAAPARPGTPAPNASGERFQRELSEGQSSSAELWNLGTYTRELKKRLPAECFRPVRARLWWMVPHLTVVLGGIALVVLGDLHWAANLGLSALIGVSFSSLGFLGHEVLHGGVVRTPWLRDIVGSICFAHFNIGPRLWRKWHNTEHHGHTQQAHRDPDTVEAFETLEERPKLQAFYFLPLWVRSFVTSASMVGWFSYHSFQMLRRYYRDFGRERLVVVGQFLAPLSVWMALLAFTGPSAFLFAYLLPVMLANSLVMSYITTNHLLNPQTPVNDPLVNSLTVTVPRWMNVLHLNFSYHTEHHVFPKMNLKHAPVLQRHLRELWPERYNVMPLWRALLSLWRTPRLYRGLDALYDPARNAIYPVLGRGLDPRHIACRPLPPDR